MSSRYEIIKQKLEEAFQPSLLEIENESHRHGHHQQRISAQGQVIIDGVPGSKAPNTMPETHFKVMMVSPAFDGLSRVDRQRSVYKVLDHELKTGLHALTLRILTPEEFAKEQPDFKSPDCAHSTRK